MNITEKASDSTKTPYADAVKNNWIVPPTLTNSGTDLFKASSSVQLTFTDGVASADFTLEFAWGSHFDGWNPFKYYNSKEAEGTIDATTSETYGDDAAKVMGALGKINETKFSITFTIERVEAAA